MEGTQKFRDKVPPTTEDLERNRVRKDAEKLTLKEARESIWLKLSKR